MEKDSIIKFNEASQWSLWKFQIKVNLMASDLLKYVNGTVTTGDDFIQQDAKAQKLIVNTCGPNVLIHICTLSTSKEMWDKLQAVFEFSNCASKNLLQEQFFSYKKNEAHDIATHISTLEGIVSKLKLNDVMISESMLITKIIMTLPEEYQHFSTAWDSTAADQQNLTNLISRLMVEECRLGVQNLNANEESEALIAKHGRRKNKFDQNSQNKKGKCFKCGSTGHWKKDCYALKKRFGSQQNSKAFMSGIIKSPKDQYIWYVDSGATSHMCKHKNWFSKYITLNQPIKIMLGNGKTMEAIGSGEIEVLSFNGEQWVKKIMKDVLHSPDLYANLFSTTKAMDNGHSSRSNSNSFELLDGNDVVAVGAREGTMFKMLFKVIEPKYKANLTIKPIPLSTWHERLGHQNLTHVKNFLKRNEINYVNENFYCDGCAFGKQQRLRFKESSNKPTMCGEILHADLCGPISPSLGGSVYFLLFKDGFSHFRIVYFLKHKSEVARNLAIVIKFIEKQSGHKIKYFQTDNGKEFVNSSVKKILDEQGIQHRRSIAYTPEQNGCIERDNRTIMESARSMIHARKLNTNLWAEAVQTAVYVLNRTGTSSIENKTPFELWYGKPANFTYFKIFGSEVYVHVPKQNRKKLDPKAKKCIFVGYIEGQKGFRILNESNRVLTVRDVNFLTEKRDVTNIIINKEQKRHVEYINVSDMGEDYFEKASEVGSNGVAEEILTLPSNPNTDIPAEAEQITTGETNNHEVPLKRQYNTNSHIDERNILSSRLRSEHNLMAMALLSVSEEPKTYHDAINSEERENWEKAMQEEYDSLLKNETWVLVDKPQDQKVVDNKWVFKIKRSTDGSIERYKARLVVRGFTQEYGIDYLETFSPVLRFTSLRAVLSIIAKNNMEMLQFDVKTAFLNGDLKETIYMKQPLGFCRNETQVCKLVKSLYGLKQASRCWNQKFTQFIEYFGFKACDADPCVFVSHKRTTLILAIYVDDGIIAGMDKEIIRSVIAHLQKQFEMKIIDVGCFLGVEIKRKEDGSIFIHQESYIRRVLKKFGAINWNPVTIPADPNQTLCNFEGSKSIDYPYRELIGTLLFLTIATRPDISYAVGNSSRYVENPTEVHVTAVKRILKYIKGTMSYGLLFGRKNEQNLIGYSDADFAGDVETRKSTSGYVFMFNDVAVSWNSTRQRCVSLSTTESEYVAASEAVKELVWLQKLYTDLLNMEQNVETSLYMDNQSAIRLVKNPEFHKRTKHIDIRYHFIRQKFEENLFDLNYIATKEMVADIFTKALPRNNFERLRLLLGVQQLINVDKEWEC